MLKKFNSLKSRAKRKNLPVTISYEYYRQLKLGDCFYCGVSNMLLKFYCELLNVNTAWMTIDRKNNDLGYTPDNVVSACFLCNKIKGSFFSTEEMKEIGEKYVAPKFKKFEQEAYENFGEWCEYNVTIDELDEDFDTDLEIDLY